MLKALAFACAAALAFAGAYAALKFISSAPPEGGKKAEMVSFKGAAQPTAAKPTAENPKKAAPNSEVPSVVDKALSYAGKKIVEGLKQTPDKEIEENAEILTRKFYPLAKGALKGQLGAILEDTKREEVPKMMYQTGKDVTERVVVPFGKGMAEGVSGALKSLNDTAKDIKEFKEENKELFDAATEGIQQLNESIKKNGLPKLPALPPPPPLPGLRPPPLPTPYQNPGYPSDEVPSRQGYPNR